MSKRKPPVGGSKDAQETSAPGPPPAPRIPELYLHSDMSMLQNREGGSASYTSSIRSLEQLLERDRLRVKDGFPSKIRIGRMIKPGGTGKDRVVIVPTTVEEKFLHDRIRPEEEQDGSGGSGEGEEGEIIGEQPVRPEGEGGDGTAGQGKGEAHEIEASAYDLGRILTEKFELPNLKDKGKKKSLTRYVYDLTDRNRGFGQVLDKKATLRRIIETNIHLGNIPDPGDIDTTKMVISPKDKTYRILSKEKDFESQALVFFLRDYSGSMAGKATELVVTQHVLIYSWLTYQYARQVESRFVLHDTEAKEVPDFQSYYSMKVAGGTKVAAAFALVSEIVEKENLAADYNIYIFHGTDGDDWDTKGEETIKEIRRMLKYANRVGITIAEHTHTATGTTEVERYLKNSGLLESHKEQLRMDRMPETSEESRIIDGIRMLIS